MLSGLTACGNSATVTTARGGLVRGSFEEANIAPKTSNPYPSSSPNSPLIPRAAHSFHTMPFLKKHAKSEPMPSSMSWSKTSLSANPVHSALIAKPRVMVPPSPSNTKKVPLLLNSAFPEVEMVWVTVRVTYPIPMQPPPQKIHGSFLIGFVLSAYPCKRDLNHHKAPVWDAFFWIATLCI